MIVYCNQYIICSLIFIILSSKTFEMTSTSIHMFHGVSIHSCQLKCDNEGACLSARYTRRYHLCEMYDTNINTKLKEPGTLVYNKVNRYANVACQDDESCKKIFCSVQSIYSDKVEVFGNLYDTGSRILVKCSETKQSEVMQCLPGGVWSEQEISCKADNYSPCVNPPSLINGKHGTLSEFNKTHSILDVSCNSDFSLLAYDNILCELSTGRWTGFDSVCCENLRKADWTKVFSYQRTDRTYKIIKMYTRLHNHGTINSCKVGIYQNETFFINWKNEQIRYINFTVISDGVAVAYMLFNGLETTNKTWFSIGNLVQSSWSDLTKDSSVQVFSILGIDYRRWFVAKQASENASCTDDVVWFVVTWNIIYRCRDEETNQLTKIMYAKNGIASRFDDGGFGIADKFEIWIKNG